MDYLSQLSLPYLQQNKYTSHVYYPLPWQGVNLSKHATAQDLLEGGSEVAIASLRLRLSGHRMIVYCNFITLFTIPCTGSVWHQISWRLIYRGPSDKQSGARPVHGIEQVSLPFILSHALAGDGVTFLGPISGPPPGKSQVVACLDRITPCQGMGSGLEVAPTIFTPSLARAWDRATVPTLHTRGVPSRTLRTRFKFHLPRNICINRAFSPQTIASSYTYHFPPHPTHHNINTIQHSCASDSCPYFLIPYAASCKSIPSKASSKVSNTLHRLS